MTYFLIIALVLVLVLFVYKESSGYNIVEYDIKTGKDIKPVRFVMLSDLHDTDVTHDGNEKLLGSIKKLEPDFVILAGDMITSYTQPSSDPDVAFDFLEKLSKDHKVYFGLGNHEQRYKAEPARFPGRYDELERHIKGLGIKLLSDEYTDLDDNNIRIYGFDVPMENYKRVVTVKLEEAILENTFGSLDDDRFNILIAHNPDLFEDYAEWKPDLVLAGHMHGGIVGVPGIGGLISPQLKLFPKYDAGKFSNGDTTMIISRGIGWHSFPVRIFNKAEIVSVTIGKKE